MAALGLLHHGIILLCTEEEICFRDVLFFCGGVFFRTVKAHQEYVGLLLLVEALRGFVEHLRSAESADTEEACFRLM